MPDRPVPLLGTLSLDAVQHIEHLLDAGFVSTPIAGLEGELQQHAGRGSHRVALGGVLTGEGAADDLAALQAAAADGAELAFSADITSALELQQVVVESFQAAEAAGLAGTWSYELVVAESPALPPPAEVAAFGGLGDFGLGDLGVDLGVLDEIADAAGELAGAVDAAMEVVDQLSALSDLAGLGGLGGFLEPLSRQVEGVRSAADGFGGAADAAGESLG
jgi:hypothetical protein